MQANFVSQSPASSLDEVFHGFTNGQSEMENKTLVKVCKDCGLMDAKHLTSTDIDLIFAKVKAKGARKITFDQFLQALELIAHKKGLP